MNKTSILSTVSVFFLIISHCTLAQVQKGLDIDGGFANDAVGTAVSMPDANTVAVGEPFFGGVGKGRVRVFSWDGSAWNQKGSYMYGEANDDRSGSAVSMPDANTVAIGAYLNDGNGNYAGHVRIYAWNGSNWIQKGSDIDGEAAFDRSGHSVSMPDANTVAIGAIWNDWTGSESGHARVYEWNGSAWVQKGIDLDGEAEYDYAGYSVSMPDANTVAVSAVQNDGNGVHSGHARVYTWSGTAWVQKGIDLDGEAEADNSGNSVSMPDANTIAIGAEQNDGNGEDAGHVRVYEWSGSAWMQKGTDLDGDAVNDRFGFSVSMPDANTLAVSAPNNDDSENDAGSVYIFKWSGTDWVLFGSAIGGEAPNDYSGRSVSMGDNNTVAIGAPYNDGGASNAGHVRVYSICTPATGIDVQVACDQFTWIDGNTYSSSNNTATHAIVGGAANGCDSILTLDLTINNAATGTVVVNACESFTWIDGNTYFTSNNTTTHTINGAALNGCDSILTLDLTIDFTTFSTDLITACELYTWIDGNTYTSSTNSPTWTLTNAAGCDSVITLNLTINSSDTATDIQTACNSYTWVDGNTYTSSNNSAEYILTNSAGCDSTVTLDLTIDSVSDITTTISGNIITANNPNASYQWLDCNDNYAPIPNENGQSLTATVNGEYAVLLTENNCTDTSACVPITIVGIIENSFKTDFDVYPNPTKDLFNINFNTSQEAIEMKISDSSGKLIFDRIYTHIEVIRHELNGHNGVYMIEVSDMLGQQSVIRLIKQ
jgi:hypothetical protein